jgi:hypothetical protein
MVKQHTLDAVPGIELVAHTMVTPGPNMVPGSWL